MNNEWCSAHVFRSMKNIVLILSWLVPLFQTTAQSVPATEENIPYLVTFGSQSDKAWGDDDFSQSFFFIIPSTWRKPFFIRIYDPDCGNNLDEIKGQENTQTSFTVYGGKGAYTEPDATSPEPIGKFNSGTVLASRSFDNNSKYDSKWFSFGPFNPSEGEFVPEYKGTIFKIIARGTSGNDGNLYMYYISTQSNENKPVEGANAFTYEYSFRLWNDPGSISHIYPFINEKVISIKIHTFDFDNDGEIRIVSLAKKSERVKTSGDNHWTSSTHSISNSEKNSSLDIQLIKLKKSLNNNVVFYITNQYGDLLPFYTSPIGGIPKYPYEIKHRSYNGSH